MVLIVIHTSIYGIIFGDYIMVTNGYSNGNDYECG